MITFGNRSLEAMIGIHPDLRKVLDKAAEMAEPAEDFTVLQGPRTREQMMENYGKGRTIAELAKWNIPARYARPQAAKVTWLRNPFMSDHRVMEDGYGHAVDLAPYPIDFDDIKRYVQLYHLIMAAARCQGIKLRSGMDWDKDGNLMEKGETDLGHYELVS